VIFRTNDRKLVDPCRISCLLRPPCILIQIADLALKVEYHKQCDEKYMCKRFPQLVFQLDQSYETQVKLFMQSASVKKKFYG
jgi:hypothetical protein